MDAFEIEGGARLAGEIRVNGSKNAALPLMAASLLTDQPLTLADVPDLSDIRNMRHLLDELGVEINQPQPGQLTLQTTDTSESHARYDIVKTMRASVCVLGPLLAARGRARVSLPGGCAIGQRPIDLHLHGLEALGARFQLEQGDVIGHVPGGRLVGNRIFLGGSFGSTVLGTANIISAATLARGTTIVESAACEPEIVDLANLLNRMGARISGAGSPRITIEGVDQLGGASHRVIPDRIEAGTLMVAAAITRSELTITNCPLDALMAATNRLEAIGVVVEPADDALSMRSKVRISAGESLSPCDITTQPHPGFPTDLQAQFMALLAVADGHSVITEKIFPERFLHVAELSRMGARLFRQGPTTIVSGVGRLVGAPVMASDLRASAGLVLAALAARGTSRILRVYHLDRGYERLEERLAAVGARIKRIGLDEHESPQPKVVVRKGIAPAYQP
ncbi:MAG TPA: UDP-N-acetylglucosamine 1-carboxyvinyltransferase [Phycisphaerales bacterium]|nr:UDP-N-acetylglucosamine 1-carboxyvinyltransferase [Phycisphaerales bacterium]